MSHTLHRRGVKKDLTCDFPFVALSARGVNRDRASDKMKQIMEICLRYKPDNLAQGNKGNIYNYSVMELEKSMDDSSTVFGVFSDAVSLKECLREIKEKDIGLSIVISGLTGMVKEICEEIGIEIHTISNSAGFLGDNERIPDEEILEITTMCGHGMISADAVKEHVVKVKENWMTVKEASIHLASMCHCGVFNPVRARKLISRLCDSYFYEKI